MDDPFFQSLHRRFGGYGGHAGHPGSLNPATPRDLFARPAGGTPRRRKALEPEPARDVLELAQQPKREPEPEKREAVRLFDARWDRERARHGDHAMALVDAEVPSSCSHLTRVMFAFFACRPDGSRVAAGEAEGHLEKGTATARFDLPAQAEAGGEYAFIARHARAAKIGSGRLAVAAGGAVGPRLIYFSPSRNKYLVLQTDEEAEDWGTHIAAVESLRGKTLRAWETTDPAKRLEGLEEIGSRTQTLFGDKGTTARTQAGWEELLLIVDDRREKSDGRSWVFVNAYARRDGTPVKGHWMSHAEPTVQKVLDRFMQRPTKDKDVPWFKSQARLRLFKSDPRVGEQWRWRLSEKGRHPEAGGHHLEFSAEAARLRYMAGWQADMLCQPSKKKLRVGAAVDLTLSLFEGRVSGKWLWPDLGGIDLIRFLRNKTGADKALKAGKECRLRTSVEVSAATFAGFSEVGALSFPALDFSQGWEKGKGDAGVSMTAFAGIEASGGLSLALEWTPSKSVSFRSLASIGGEMGMTLGAAVQAKLNVEWKDGRFRFQCFAGLAYGLGGREKVTFDLSVNEGRDLLAHLFHCVDHHYVEEISQEAFKTLEERTYSLWHGLTQSITSGFRHLKATLRHSAGMRTLIKGTPPAALGRVLLDLMQAPEEEDFRAILRILHGCGPNQLQWTLRLVSEMDLRYGSPGYETVKSESLQAGRTRMRNFGQGVPGLEISRRDYVQELDALFYTMGI